MNLLKSNLPKYVYLYFFGQSINLLAGVMSVTVISFVGISLAPNPIYATLPYGFQFLLLFLGTYPISKFMGRYGRNKGFIFGALSLFASGILGFLSVKYQNFTLLIIAHGLIGVFSASANFYRYAVTDSLSDKLKSKALSLVVSSGVIAGILGPTLSISLSQVSYYPKFSLCYAFLSILAILNLIIIFFLPRKNQLSSKKEACSDLTDNKSTSKNIYIAIGVAALGYGLMNLLMIQSSLNMHHMHIDFESSSFAIQWHVIAMFFPSFFTGYLIVKLSHIKIIKIGIILFILCFLINLSGTGYGYITTSLILLGVAWNFTYVGGSSMLASQTSGHKESTKWQGIGDTVIAICATLGAFLPSLLLNSIGWKLSNIVFLCLCLLFALAIYILQRAERQLKTE